MHASLTLCPSYHRDASFRYLTNEKLYFAGGLFLRDGRLGRWSFQVNVLTKNKPGINASLIAAQIDQVGALSKRSCCPSGPTWRGSSCCAKPSGCSMTIRPAAEPFEARGDKFVAIIGPRAHERSINPAKLIKAIGLKVYATLATLTLRVLEENVAADIVANVVTTAPTGARSIKTFERQPNLMRPARFYCGPEGILDTQAQAPCVVDEKGIVHGTPAQIRRPAGVLQRPALAAGPDYSCRN